MGIHQLHMTESRNTCISQSQNDQRLYQCGKANKKKQTKDPNKQTNQNKKPQTPKKTQKSTAILFCSAISNRTKNAGTASKHGGYWQSVILCIVLVF